MQWTAFSKIASISLILAVFFAGSFLLIKGTQWVYALGIPLAEYGFFVKKFEPASVVFTGDVMLARDVERTMLLYDTNYPFVNLASIFKERDLVVGNFEASVPEKHTPTPSLTMRFSVQKEFLPSLAIAGFDVFSLANNHSLDYGHDGYAHTVASCIEANLVCVGHSTEVSTSSLYTKKVGSSVLGIIFIHTLFDMPTAEVLAPLLFLLKETSDIQVAYIHWGDEYVLTHNAAQESLAYALVDQGIDAVIGHHPHVVQDIVRYKGKPIFYSLGNLIFDQYFSDYVAQGYLVNIEIEKKKLVYILTPYETKSTRVQPVLQSDTENTFLFNRIFSTQQFSESEIADGRFVVLRD